MLFCYSYAKESLEVNLQFLLSHPHVSLVFDHIAKPIFRRELQWGIETRDKSLLHESLMGLEAT